MIKLLNILTLITFIIILNSCNTKERYNSFKEDLEILQNIGDIDILKTGNSLVAVSGKIQGRVFTSSSKGENGISYGWFQRKSISNGEWNNNFSSLGGEDRLWFGPQFGKYAVFFEPGVSQVSENIKISPDLDTLKFKQLQKSSSKITYGAAMKIKNYNNFIFNIDIKRTVAILGANETEKNLDIILPNNISYVGFTTKNTIKNIGTTKWTKENGLISIWNLGCMIPDKKAVVIIPIRGKLNEVTNYFTPLDSSRIQVKNNAIFYKGDANYLNKIGTLPENSLNVFGSYNPSINLLTIVKFSFNRNGLFVNSNKEPQTDPYKGDVINVFNDGIFEDGGPFGPFFELETSSHSKELNVGESQTHSHSTYHFEGNKDELNQISTSVLGISIQEIEQVFNKI